jgi:hypothetical protein
VSPSIDRIAIHCLLDDRTGGPHRLVDAVDVVLAERPQPVIVVAGTHAMADVSLLASVIQSRNAWNHTGWFEDHERTSKFHTYVARVSRCLERRTRIRGDQIWPTDLMALSRNVRSQTPVSLVRAGGRSQRTPCSRGLVPRYEKRPWHPCLLAGVRADNYDSAVTVRLRGRR